MESQLEYNIHKQTRFCTFRVDLFAPSVLINKISASELSQKFIKSALLVAPDFFSLPLPATSMCVCVPTASRGNFPASVGFSCNLPHCLLLSGRQFSLSCCAGTFSRPLIPTFSFVLVL